MTIARIMRSEANRGLGTVLQAFIDALLQQQQRAADVSRVSARGDNNFQLILVTPMHKTMAANVF